MISSNIPPANYESIESRPVDRQRFHRYALYRTLRFYLFRRRVEESDLPVDPDGTLSVASYMRILAFKLLKMIQLIKCLKKMKLKLKLTIFLKL
ncbi:hypothetical protein TNCT_674221 [Trichonephila clavata]|uniref:Uncharacterized protein n=1 Tax=Trichonephila clavata TaxID=2740835 RepID=A0A8X6LVS5_TRICU|nr:hypothetical protein TNCT_674221 [Trichonephila clavata]